MTRGNSPNRLLAILAIAFSAFVPSTAAARPFLAPSANQETDQFRFGVFLQPDLTIQSDDGGNWTSRFRVRRARLDVRGQVLDERASFRLHFNFGPTGPQLFDAWVNARLSESWALRVGRDRVPHHAQWETNPATQVFPDRSQIVRTWGVPSGRDAGMSLRSEQSHHTFIIGVYQGQTSAAQRDIGEHLYAARATVAIVGDQIVTEVPTRPVGSSSLVLGAGGFASLGNNWQDHSLGADNEALTADLYRGFLDLRLRYGGFSAYLEGAVSHTVLDVSPDTVSGRTGVAGGLTTALLLPGLPPSVLAVRLGVLTHDLSRVEEASTGLEWGTSVLALHEGTTWYTRLTYQGERGAGSAVLAEGAEAHTRHAVLLDHILQF